MKTTTTERPYHEAIELRDEAERIVQLSEARLADAIDPTARDILETKYREDLALQDEVLATVAPSVERHRAALRDKAIEVAKSARNEPGCDWSAKFRCGMSPGTKSAVIRKFGLQAYESLPWEPGRR